MLTVPQTPGTWWIEVGAIHGLLCCTSGGNSAQNSARWFWFDNRPVSGGIAAGHSWGPAATNSPTDVGIYWQQNNTYLITIGGYQAGYSTSHPCCGHTLETGSETYNITSGTLAQTAATNLWYISLGGTAYSPWNASYTPGHSIGGVMNSPPYNSGVWYLASWVYGY